MCREEVKLFLCPIKHHTMKMYGEVMAQLHAFMTFAQDGGEWSASCSGCFTIGIHWTGVWAGSRAGFNVLDKRKITSPVNRTQILICPASSLSLYHVS
jgi:hypothetical protein